jgi:hypothetical protein
MQFDQNCFFFFLQNTGFCFKTLNGHGLLSQLRHQNWILELLTCLMTNQYFLLHSPVLSSHSMMSVVTRGKGFDL